VSLRFLLLLLALTTGIAAAEDFRVWGHSDQDSHFLSVAELIGRPEYFDEQPVSVVGFAQFRDNDQPVFRLYATRDDLNDSIPAAVKTGTFDESLAIDDADLASLNGKVVLIEGTFHMYERPKLKPGKKPTTICMADCGMPGEIANILQVTTWPPR